MNCIYARCGRKIPEGSTFCPWCGKKQKHERIKKKQRRAPGSGCVRKLTDHNRSKPWVALKNGKSIGSTFATEREAVAALEALEEVQSVDLYNATLEQYYKAWANTAYKDCTPSFKNDYTNAWKHFTPELRAMKLRDAKHSEVQSLIDSLYEAGKSKSVQSKVKSLYSFLCNMAYANDVINKNYASFVKVHATERKRDGSVFTWADLQKLSRAAEGSESDRQTQTARIVMIYLFTGMRLSELLPLPCASVFLDVDYPYLVGGEKTEAGRNRAVPIISTIRPYVRWFVEHAEGEGVFSAYIGNKDPQKWRRRDYYPLLESLGIPKRTPHGTRRTAATMAVEANVDPAALQKIGGWREFDTIQKYYARPDVEYLSTQMEQIAVMHKKRIENP